MSIYVVQSVGVVVGLLVAMASCTSTNTRSAIILSGNAGTQPASEYPNIISIPVRGNFGVSDGFGGSAPSPMGWLRDGLMSDRRWYESNFSHDDGDYLCFFRRELFPCVGHYEPTDSKPSDFHPSIAKGQKLIPVFPFNATSPGITRDLARGYVDVENRFETGGGVCGAADVHQYADSCDLSMGFFVSKEHFEIDEVTLQTVRTVYDATIDPFIYDAYAPLDDLRAGEIVWNHWMNLARLGPAASCVGASEMCPVVVILHGQGRPLKRGFDVLYCGLHAVGGVLGAPSECTAVGYQDQYGGRFLLAHFRMFRGVGADGGPDLKCGCSALTGGSVVRALADEPQLGLTTELRTSGDNSSFMVVGVRREERSLVWNGYRELSTVTVTGLGNSSVIISSAVVISKQNVGSAGYHGLTDKQKIYYKNILADFATNRLGCECTSLLPE